MSAPAVSLDFVFAPIPTALLYAGHGDYEHLEEVTPIEIRVYASLAQHGLDPKNCFPSKERIARLIGVAAKTVQRALSSLAKKGWITITHRFRENGSQSSNAYRLHGQPRPGGGARGRTPTGGTSSSPHGGAIQTPLESDQVESDQSKQKDIVSSQLSLTPRLAPQPPAVVDWLEFPVMGSTKTWSPLVDQVERWQQTFPGLDVRGELQKAATWCHDNWLRRKTDRGMPRFLFTWLERAQNSGRNAVARDNSGPGRGETWAQWRQRKAVENLPTFDESIPVSLDDIIAQELEYQKSQQTNGETRHVESYRED